MKDHRSALWIEDQPESFPAIRDILCEQHEEVDQALSAADAEDMLAKRGYDVVVLDVILPRGGRVMDPSPYLGARLLSRVREGITPVIFTFLAEVEVKLVVPEGAPRYRYFSKSEIGPKLEDFMKAVSGEEVVK